MNRLQQIAPAQLGAVWERVRPGLVATGASDGTTPEDVYCALKMGGASLHMIELDSVEVGFIVLRAINDFDGVRLHIWVLHAISEEVDVMAEFSDEIDNIGRSIHAANVTFGTNRRGWAKVAPRHRFEVREIVYQRKIKP